MRIAIFGTGGAGGYFGAQLARAGEDVIFIARGEHLQAIRANGLHVETPQGEVVIQPAQATDHPAEAGNVDVVMLGVKTWQVTEAARAMKPMIGRETFVVPLQNGVDATSQLKDILGVEHVLGGSCATFSWIAGPGRIQTIGDANIVRFGELDGGSSERTQRLRKIFERAGVKTEIPTDIQAAIWQKFLFVASFGGVGAVTRAPIGVIRGQPETRRMLEGCMREIFDVAKAHHIGLTQESVKQAMNFVDSLAPQATTSLQRDIADGRPSELEAWNGAAVRLGRETGVAAPLHEFIYHSLLPLERRARGELEFPS